MNGRQSGQLIIIVALAMIAFMGFAALVVDLGYAYAQKRLAQNGADAATMAAVRMVRSSDPQTPASTVYSEIVRVAALNGNSQVDSTNTVFVDINGNTLGPVASYSGSLESVAGVQVRTSIQYNTYFAGVLGINSLTSAGTASAMSVSIGGVGDLADGGIRPIGVPNQTYTVGSIYTIWDDSKEASGNAGWLDLDAGSNGASDLGDWLRYGFDPSPTNPFVYYEYGASPGAQQSSQTLPIPCWVDGNPGIKASAKDDVAAIVGTSISVLLYDTLTGTGANSSYRIVGVAQFVITSVDMTGNPKTVTGRFERAVLSGDGSSSYTTSLVSTVRLVPNAVPTSAPSPTTMPVPSATAAPAWPTDTPVPTMGPGATATPTATTAATATPTATTAPTPTATATPTPPTAPTLISVVEQGSTSILVTWADNSANETGFYVWRSPDGASKWTVVGTTGSDTTGFLNTGLTPNSWYYYRVQAYNAGGGSAYSAVIRDKTRN